MAAHDLTLPTIPSLPFVDGGTCSSSAGNVRRVNVTRDRALEYCVTAHADAIKVAIPSNTSPPADEASGAALKFVTVPAYGDYSFVIGPNKLGKEAPARFYIFSATVSATYSVGVSELRS